MRFIFCNLNICVSGAAEQVVSANGFSDFRQNKGPCFFCNVILQSVHIFAVAVNRLYGTAQFLRNGFYSRFFNSVLSGYLKGGVTTISFVILCFGIAVPP